MELYQLKTFLAVAQHGHLTQAAEYLHLSQPAVTAQIKALEENVGGKLFERNTNGVRLTRVGEELVPLAHQTLAAARLFLTHAKSLQGSMSEKVKIGVPFLSEVVDVAPWVVELIRRYPLLDVLLCHELQGDVLNLVRKKELDAGFYLGYNPFENVHTQSMGHFNLRIAVPTEMVQRIDLNDHEQLGQLPWVGIMSSSSVYKSLVEFWRMLNIAPKKMAEADCLTVGLNLARAGVGVALVMEEAGRAAEQEGRVVLVPNVHREIELAFVWASERDGDALIVSMREALSAVCEG